MTLPVFLSAFRSSMPPHGHHHFCLWAYPGTKMGKEEPCSPSLAPTLSLYMPVQKAAPGTAPSEGRNAGKQISRSPFGRSSVSLLIREPFFPCSRRECGSGSRKRGCFPTAHVGGSGGFAFGKSGTFRESVFCCTGDGVLNEGVQLLVIKHIQ